IRRAPGFAVPALTSLAFGTGLGAALSRIVHIESLVPLRLVSALGLDAVRNAGWTIPVRSATSIQGAGLDRAVWLLAGLAAIGLVAVCLNLAVLTLMRGASRRREAAIQAALGAAPGRLQRRTAAEGLVLAGVGASAGALLGVIAGAALGLTWPHGSASLAYIGLQSWGLLVGVFAPAAAVIAPPLVAAIGALNGPGWARLLSVGERATPGGAERFHRQALVVLQVACSLVCLTTAGLLASSAMPRSETVALGFDPRDTLVIEVDLADGAERVAAYEGLLQRVTGLEAVQGAALSTPGTVAAVGPEALVTAECGACVIGLLRVAVSPTVARHHAVSPGFFAAVRASLVSGREFDGGDRVGNAPVAIVNRSFAQRHFEAGDPMGKRVQIGGARGEWYTVVGVVGDLRGHAIGSAPEETPAVYLPLLQQPASAVDLVVRGGDVKPQVLAATLATALPALGFKTTLSEPTSLEANLLHLSAPLRWLAWVFGILGMLALAITIHGLAAVMRFEVRQRRREIGTRVALGARPWMIVVMVVRQTLRLAAVGVGLGILATFPLADGLGRVLPRLQVELPLLVGGIVITLAVTAVLAAAWPARSAARLDPARALQAN
ncbi:MAG TPA: FtsX-like permease family protein, partial [Gemmatimonadota bacterium]|nr:FtsX-like permease family protein [Gemmatimonadota bacterium]